MTFWLYCGSNACKVWVEATKCSGNMSALRVFVHQDNLPTIPTPDAGPVFPFDGYCWSVDPEGDRVCLPKGTDIATADPSGSYIADCATCEGAPPPDVPGDSDTSDPQQPGGGGVGDDGGMGGGGDPVDGETCGVQATICAAHEPFYQAGVDPDVYVLCAAVPDAAGVFRVGGLCFEIDPADAEVEPIPAGALVVNIAAVLPDCEACAFGVKATLCEGQDEDLAIDLWVRKPDLPENVVTFKWAGLCYQLDPEGDLELLPFGALVFNPVDEFEDCDACRQGVQYQLCAGQDDPGGELWAEASELAAFTGTIYQKINGLCYSLDTDAGTEDITPGAVIVVPRDECESCAQCLCGACVGDGATESGYKANACADQDGPFSDLWVVAADLPGEFTVFRHDDGKCYWISPAAIARPIPIGATIVRINNSFGNCFDCVTDGGGDDGDDGGGGGGDFPPDWPGLPPECWLRLFECDTGIATNRWVRMNHLAAVHGIVPPDALIGKVVHLAAPDDGWYELGDKTCQDDAPGQTVTGQVDDLVAACPVHSCALCSTNPPGIQPNATDDGGGEPGAPCFLSLNGGAPRVWTPAFNGNGSPIAFLGEDPTWCVWEWVWAGYSLRLYHENTGNPGDDWVFARIIRFLGAGTYAIRYEGNGVGNIHCVDGVIQGTVAMTCNGDPDTFTVIFG